jgi:hypothetical protein
VISLLLLQDEKKEDDDKKEEETFSLLMNPALFAAYRFFDRGDKGTLFVLFFSTLHEN